METIKLKKAVIYCRVSTKEQVEEGNSLVTQEKICKEYAKKNGYEVVALFIEQGESAKTADRPELKKLMSFCAIKKNGINVVIAYKIDRISRNTDDYSQIRILLRRYGVEIKSTSEFFEDSPAGRFMENIIANVAQFDNDVRAERSVNGMRDAVREGRYVWLAPYGYSNVKVSGKATITPNHLAPLVRKAFEEVALNVYPLNDIRRKLIAEGLINSKGKPISQSHFYHILRHKLYAGWINKFEEQHKGAFESIISDELFNQVQYVLSGKRIKDGHYTFENPDFPLRRFIRHTSGTMLTGGWSRGRDKRYAYYLIRKEKINIRKEELEGKFKHWLNRFKLDIKHFEKLEMYVKKHLGTEFEERKIEVEKLQRKVAGLKEKQHQILEKNLQGIISNELCREKIAGIDTELFQINRIIKNLPEAKIDHKRLLSVIKDILKSPGDVWEKADFKTKIKLQWFYFPHGIEIDKEGNRTTKICKLFMLKEHISPYYSSNVPHPFSKSNTDITQISLPSENNIDLESPEFWHKLGEEIQYLASLK